MTNSLWIDRIISCVFWINDNISSCSLSYSTRHMLWWNEKWFDVGLIKFNIDWFWLNSSFCYFYNSVSCIFWLSLLTISFCLDHIFIYLLTPVYPNIISIKNKFSDHYCCFFKIFLIFLFSVGDQLTLLYDHIITVSQL